MEECEKDYEDKAKQAMALQQALFGLDVGQVSQVIIHNRGGKSIRRFKRIK